VIDYFFSPVSPWTYLGHERFHAIRAQHGAEIRYKPTDYGASSRSRAASRSGSGRSSARPIASSSSSAGATSSALRSPIQPKFFPVAVELRGADDHRGAPARR